MQVMTAGGKLEKFGVVVNKCRNYAIASLSYGPRVSYGEKIIESIAAFPYAVKDNLRDLPYIPST